MPSSADQIDSGIIIAYITWVSCNRCRHAETAPGRKLCASCVIEMAARRAANLAAGLCRCGKQTSDGRRSCGDCRATRRAWVAANRAAGKCACGKTRTPDSARCAACLRAARDFVGAARSRGLCDCASAPAEPGKRLCRQCLNKCTNYARRLRGELIEAYGGICSCCGEDTPEFLALDHIRGGGNIDRRKGLIGAKLYARVKREGYPKDRYQLLCHNCNSARGYYGVCPHERQRATLETKTG